MNIHRCASADEAKRELAHQVSASLASYKMNGVPVLFFFSGGSALGILDLLDVNTFGSYLTVAPVDERYDPSGEASNFVTLSKTAFFKRAEETDTHFIDTSVKIGQGRDELAHAYETGLRLWIKSHPDGKILAILGMGPDGHTAGIFPSDDSRLFHTRFESDQWIVGYRAPEYATIPERITTTLTFLRNETDTVFVFACGPDKTMVFQKFLTGPVPENILPATIFHQLSDLDFYTDLE